MKIVVAHKSPDLDAISSIWLIKSFLPGWEKAVLSFVPAGSKMQGTYEAFGEVIERVDGNEVIHVDTGLGKLDHHQTDDTSICASSLTLDFVLKSQKVKFHDNKTEALKRMIKVIVEHDHFKELERSDVTADYHEFELDGILEGLEYQFPQEDARNSEFIMLCLNAILHNMENKIWAENELKEKGIEFDTKWGKAIGVETINDLTLKLAQKKGYNIAVRKDPHNGKVRIKARPKTRENSVEIDLTPVFEKLRSMDADASWFLHVSRKMLLNGSSKNPEMKGSKLTLHEVIDVLKNL